MTTGLESSGDAWTAVGLGVAVGVQELDLVEQGRVGVGAGGGDGIFGVIEARARAIQGCTEFGDGESGPQRVD